MRKFRISKLIISYLLVFMFSFAFISCSHQNFVRSTYRVLSSSANIYDASMKSASDLYNQHVISDKEKAKIVHIAKLYKDSFLICNNAMSQYMLKKTPENQKKAQEALVQMNKALSNLIQEINSYNKIKSAKVGGK